MAAVAEEAVEPSHSRTDNLHHKADVEHCEQGAGSDDVPEPSAEKEVAADDGERDKSCVDDNLNLGEGHSADCADGYLDTFAGHGDGAAADFRRYAGRHNRAAYELRDDLCREGAVVNERGEIHIRVDQRSEHKADKELEKLHFFKAVPQNQPLEPDEKPVRLETFLCVFTKIERGLSEKGLWCEL